MSRTGEQHFNPGRCRITQIFGENRCRHQDIKRKVSEVLVLLWAMLLVLSIEDQKCLVKSASYWHIQVLSSFVGSWWTIKQVRLTRIFDLEWSSVHLLALNIWRQLCSVLDNQHLWSWVEVVVPGRHNFEAFYVPHESC